MIRWIRKRPEYTVQRHNYTSWWDTTYGWTRAAEAGYPDLLRCSRLVFTYHQMLNSKLTISKLRSMGYSGPVDGYISAAVPIHDPYTMVFPIAMADIPDDWWLRHHDGSTIDEYVFGVLTCRYVDLGKPAVRTAWISNMLPKLKSWGVNGVHIDAIHSFMVSMSSLGNNDVVGYASDAEWVSNALLPFLDECGNELRRNGIVVVGGNSHYYGTDIPHPLGRLQRPYLDGISYEFITRQLNGNPYSAADIIPRLWAMYEDPLMLLVCDQGCTEPEMLTLVCYLAALPESETLRRKRYLNLTRNTLEFPQWSLVRLGKPTSAMRIVGNEVERTFQYGAVWANLQTRQCLIDL